MRNKNILNPMVIIAFALALLASGCFEGESKTTKKSTHLKTPKTEKKPDADEEINKVFASAKLFSEAKVTDQELESEFNKIKDNGPKMTKLLARKTEDLPKDLSFLYLLAKGKASPKIVAMLKKSLSYLDSATTKALLSSATGKDSPLQILEAAARPAGESPADNLAMITALVTSDLDSVNQIKKLETIDGVFTNVAPNEAGRLFEKFNPALKGQWSAHAEAEYLSLGPVFQKLLPNIDLNDKWNFINSILKKFKSANKLSQFPAEAHLYGISDNDLTADKFIDSTGNAQRFLVVAAEVLPGDQTTFKSTTLAYENRVTAPVYEMEAEAHILPVVTAALSGDEGRARKLLHLPAAGGHPKAKAPVSAAAKDIDVLSPVVENFIRKNDAASLTQVHEAIKQYINAGKDTKDLATETYGAHNDTLLRLLANATPSMANNEVINLVIDKIPDAPKQIGLAATGKASPLMLALMKAEKALEASIEQTAGRAIVANMIKKGGRLGFYDLEPSNLTKEFEYYVQEIGQLLAPAELEAHFKDMLSTNVYKQWLGSYVLAASGRPDGFKALAEKLNAQDKARLVSDLILSAKKSPEKIASLLIAKHQDFGLSQDDLRSISFSYQDSKGSLPWLFIRMFGQDENDLPALKNLMSQLRSALKLNLAQWKAFLMSASDDIFAVFPMTFTLDPSFKDKLPNILGLLADADLMARRIFKQETGWKESYEDFKKKGLEPDPDSGMSVIHYLAQMEAGEALKNFIEKFPKSLQQRIVEGKEGPSLKGLTKGLSYPPLAIAAVAPVPSIPNNKAVMLIAMLRRSANPKLLTPDGLENVLLAVKTFKDNPSIKPRVLLDGLWTNITSYDGKGGGGEDFSEIEAWLREKKAKGQSDGLDFWLSVLPPKNKAALEKKVSEIKK